MKKNFLLIGGFLIFLLLFSTVAHAQNYKFDIFPYYKDHQGNDLSKYEAGGSLLRPYMRIMTTSGTINLWGINSSLGKEDGTKGFEKSKIEAVGKEEFSSGYNWNLQLGGLSYDNNNGFIYYSRGTVQGQKGKDITTAVSNLYRIDFRVKDGIAPSNSYLRYDAINKNNVAVDGNNMNKLNAQDDFNFDILAAAPPQNFIGVVNVISTDKGNTLTINWTALSNKIGENDWTPPILYDIYRNAGGGSFTPNDNTNRKFEGQAMGKGLGDSGGPVAINDGPDSGVPGAGNHALSDNTEYRYIIRAKDSTTPNRDSIIPPTKHKTTDTDNIISVAVKPHDYTPPEWVGATGFAAKSDNATLGVSWKKPDKNADDTGGYVVLRQGPFDASQSLGVPPDLSKASGDNHGPEYKEGDKKDKWTVRKVFDDKTGNTVSFPDDKLENGKYYYYLVYAFDQYGNIGGAFQQGRNYSQKPAVGAGVPGLPPSALENFIAVSAPETGQISLFWNKPAELYYGGAIFWYSTDFENKWSWYKVWGKSESGPINDRPDAAPKDWIDKMNEKKIGILAVYKTDPGIKAGEQEKLVVTKDLAGNLLVPKEVSFIKGLAHNDTKIDFPSDPASVTEDVLSGYRFSDIKMAAALPAGAGGGGGPIAYTFKNGLNAFAVPSNKLTVTVKDKEPVKVENVAQFMNAIGSKKVTAFGWLDEDGQMVGYYVADGEFNWTKGVAENPSEEFLVRGRAYQIYVLVDDKVEVTISGQ
ncbi:MAG: hypothetical protein ABIA67_03250 [Candidatus Margulisiibacteriota bacterium]